MVSYAVPARKEARRVALTPGRAVDPRRRRGRDGRRRPAPGAGVRRTALPRPALGLADLERLGAVALDRARKLGCSYADIRINRYRNRTVGMRTSPDRSAGAEARKFNHVPSATESESFGFGVRVLRNGVGASPRARG